MAPGTPPRPAATPPRRREVDPSYVATPAMPTSPWAGESDATLSPGMPATPWPEGAGAALDGAAMLDVDESYPGTPTIASISRVPLVEIRDSFNAADTAVAHPPEEPQGELPLPPFFLCYLRRAKELGAPAQRPASRERNTVAQAANNGVGA